MRVHAEYRMCGNSYLCILSYKIYIVLYGKKSNIRLASYKGGLQNAGNKTIRYGLASVCRRNSDEYCVNHLAHYYNIIN